jgi:RHS repeat-associated protein
MKGVELHLPHSPCQCSFFSARTRKHRYLKRYPARVTLGSWRIPSCVGEVTSGCIPGNLVRRENQGNEMAILGRHRRVRQWIGMLLFLLTCGVLHAQQQGTVTYVYTDPQGTPLAEADAHGNITATYDYTPYGTIALGTPTAGPGYTGHVADPETNLVYMQARYYDAATGHFLSADPIGPAAGNTFNFNRYAYVNNNPVNHIDPNGKCLEDGCIGEAASACAAAPACSRAVMAAGAATIAFFTVRAVHNTTTTTTQNNNSDVPLPTPAPGTAPAPTTDAPKDSQRPSKTPNDGEPGSTYKNPGSGQEREYGPDGKPSKDIDYDHDHGQGTPHVHEWGRDPNGNPVRGPGRAPNPQTEPHIAPPNPPPPSTPPPSSSP